MDDERFARFATDPKFRTVPKREKKLKIDPRFQHVFTDKRFDNKKIGIDKRGRPKSYASKESYEQFYRIESSDGESDSAEENEKQVISAKHLKRKVDESVEKKQSKTKEKNLSSITTPVEQEKVKQDVESIELKKQRANMKSTTVDYARGEGQLESDSSSEESSDEEDTPKHSYDGFDKWGELDHDAKPISTGEETNRLAICNLDWDRVCATDIYVALNSFCSNLGGSGKICF